MDTSKPTVNILFTSGTRYQIPPYQREYQWNAERWQSLWHDLGSLYDDQVSSRKTLPPHFIGAIIVEQETSQPGAPPTSNVIDGQQRLVTLAVLLAAVRDSIADAANAVVPPQHGLSWIRDEAGKVAGPRLEVQEVDRDGLRRAMEVDWRDWYGQARDQKYLKKDMILYAYTYFRYCIWNGLGSFDDAQDAFTLPLFRASTLGVTAESLWDVGSSGSGIVRQPIDLVILNSMIRDRLFVLNITLEQGDEDGPTIFDTMNAKRTQLEQWDFIRNSVFIRLPAKDRGVLFGGQWAPAQKELVQTTYTGLRAQSRDAFVYDYLIARGESVPQGTINRNRGHEQFMKRLNRVVGSSGGPATLGGFLTADFLPALHAWCCAVGARDSVEGAVVRILPPEAQVARNSVMALSAGPPIPVLLHFIDGWARGKLNDKELTKSLRILESYVARHVICQTPMSPFRAHFMQVMGAIRNKYTADALYAQLSGSWMTDDEVRNSLKDQPLYESVKPGQLGAIFRGLEFELGGHGANSIYYGKKDDQYSVEHVYPKSSAKGPNKFWAPEFAAWGSSADNINWVADHRNYIGNLTVLTNYANKRLQASAFSKKRAAYRGENTAIKIPPLAVNKDINRVRRWTKTQIEARTKRLTDAAIARWKTP